MTKELLRLIIDEHEQELKAAIILRDETLALYEATRLRKDSLKDRYDRQKRNVELLKQNFDNLEFIEIEKEDE